MAIIGVGIDVVEIERFERSLERSPSLRTKIFTEAERELGTHSLAARWAAKEALAKALGAPAGLHWHDCEVVKDAAGKPSLSVTGAVADRARDLGIHHFHVSLSHDAGIASAVVIAES